MITNAKLAFHQHDHQRSVDAALAQAASLCAERKARLTTTRKHVLQLIWQNHQPKGAYELIDLLAEQLGKPVQPPTIYRALEFLLDMGLIHRIESLNAYIGCPYPAMPHDAVFLICNQCGAVAECSTPSISNAISATAEQLNFVVESKSVEITGICPSCQSKSVIK